MKYILPKPHLSYSQLDCWKKSPATYRQRYYHEGSYDLNTPEIRFGKDISEKLENRDPSLDHVKQFRRPEYKILVDIGGYPFLMFLDSFCPRWKKLLEYKTGKVPWSRIKVLKHKQLDIYSLGIQKLHGHVHEECELHHLVTTDKLGTRSTPIRLTGEVVVYKRTITQMERDKMEKEIIKCIKEIHNDYKQWRENR